MNTSITCSFLDYFSVVEDPRLERMRLHSVEEILLVTLAGLLANCEGWSDLEAFANDAMGCQKSIAAQIKEQGGDYILALKGNQGNLCEEVKELFSRDSLLNKGKDTSKHDTTVDKGYGRIEVRTCQVLHNMAELLEAEKWSGLNSVIKIEAQRIIGEEIESETRYYISSHADQDAAWFNRAIRSHWSIENNLHWVLVKDLEKCVAGKPMC